MIIQVDPFNTVVLDGSGNGQCRIEPTAGARWRLRLANVSTNGVTNNPTCTIYRGSSSGPLQQIDFTNTGNSASSQKVAAAPFFAGQALWAVWAGGDPGATATLQAYGEQRGRTDGPFDEALIGEGFQSIPTSVTAGIPGGARVVIGSDVPAVVRAYYAAAGITVNAAWIGMYFDANNYRYEITGTTGANDAYGTGWVQGGVVYERAAESFNGVDRVVESYGANTTPTSLDFYDAVINVGKGFPAALTADLQYSGNSLARGLFAVAQLAGNPLLTVNAGNEGVIAQLGSQTFPANRLFKFTARIVTQASVAAGQASFRLRRGVGTGGAQVQLWVDPNQLLNRKDVLLVGYMATAGAVTQDMAFTLAAAAGSNISVYATGAGQGQVVYEDVGSSVQFPAAVPAV
jgi:hypothetical protein